MNDHALAAVHAARLANLRLLLQKYGGQKELSKQLGYSSSFLSQMAGGSPSRTISEGAARAMEIKLQLLPGWMDIVRGAHRPELASVDLSDPGLITLRLYHGRDVVGEATMPAGEYEPTRFLEALEEWRSQVAAKASAPSI